MKAIVCEKYGPPEVLQLKEVDKPATKDDEVLVRVYATPVSYGDLMVRNFKNMPLSKFNMPLPLWLPTRMFFGFKKPRIKIFGSEFAGKVEATGKDVKQFKIGDQVFGYLGQKMGAYAEYICISEDDCIAIKPENVSYEEAASIPYGAIMASTILKKVTIQSGQKVLINGASGGIGSAAVQLTKYFGAEVTGVCSTLRLEYVKSLGADKILDYTKEDFTKNGETYDVIFDILGKSSFSHCKNSLKQNGIYLLASFKTRQIFQMLWTKVIGRKKVICAMASDKQKDLIPIKKLVETEKIKSIIDKIYPIEQTAEAHRYSEEGHAQGKVLITVEHHNKT